jgi:integrase
MVILTPEQLAELPDKIRPRAIVALFTGMRRGEVLALRWSNVDLDGKVIRVREALEETKEHGIRFKATKTKERPSRHPSVRHRGRDAARAPQSRA